MASLCRETKYTLRYEGGLPVYSWPANGTCQPLAGLCYTSATAADGDTVVQMGCWPPPLQGDVTYPASQCISEVQRHLCLCNNADLCNEAALPQPPNASPQFQAPEIILIVFLGFLIPLAALLIYCLVLYRRRRRRQSRQASWPSFKNSIPELDCEAAPYYTYRYPSAAASMSSLHFDPAAFLHSSTFGPSSTSFASLYFPFTWHSPTGADTGYNSTEGLHEMIEAPAESCHVYLDGREVYPAASGGRVAETDLSSGPVEDNQLC